MVLALVLRTVQNSSSRIEDLGCKGKEYLAWIRPWVKPQHQKIRGPSDLLGKYWWIFLLISLSWMIIRGTVVNDTVDAVTF